MKISKQIQNDIKEQLYQQYKYNNRIVSLQFFKEYVNIKIKTCVVNINYINEFIHTNSYLKDIYCNIIICEKKHGNNK